MAKNSDLREHIPDHIVKFLFTFGEENNYFCRDTSKLNEVLRCDKDGNIIEELQVVKYKQWLSNKYLLDEESITIDSCLAHFSRIYGKENAQEQRPFLSKRSEKDEDALKFLMKLFGNSSILDSITNAENILGVNIFDTNDTEKAEVLESQISDVEKTIKALSDRKRKLLQDKDNERLILLGLNSHSIEKTSELQNNLRALMIKRNELQSKKNAIISGNENFCNEVMEQDFEKLKEFFPDANIKALDDIQKFHIKIRKILTDEARDEAEILQNSINQYDRELDDLQDKIDKAGFTEEMSSKIISQGVSISKEIDKL